MRPLRVAMVTRRFWPLVGGAEKVLANLAGELRGRGLEPTILTARWQPQWPAEVLYQNVPVVRLAPPPQDRWTTFQFMRALSGWLRRHPARFDLVYVSQLRHEAYAALRAVSREVPVVLRAEHVGRWGDCLWQLDADCGRRIKQQCMGAATLLAPTLAAQRELEAAGYPRPRILHLPNGVPLPPPRTPPLQAAARAVLAETHASLQLAPRAFLAVCMGRLHAEAGLEHLLAAWRPLARNVPQARLWLAGPAPDRGAIQQQIGRLQLEGSVVLTGVFDQVDELLAAADLLVAPAPEGAPMALLEAMAAGLPIVAIDTAVNRTLLEGDREGLLVAARDTAALLTAVARLYKDPELAVRLGNAARARAVADYSLERMADAHEALFARLVTL